MAITSGFFNSVNRDRIYKADFFAEYFASFIANGVFPNPSTGMQVIANGNMTMSIRAGKAWIKGYYVNNDADYLLSLGVADGVLKRIDRIVLRLDFSSRQITPVVKKGTPASSPTAPSLQRDGDAYELGLADVLITNGAISISQANITDTRLNTALCGIVHGVVDQIDTTTIFNQYKTWFNEFSLTKQSEFNSWKSVQESDYTTWTAAKINEFNSWFTSIQDILSGDVAGNLLSKITQIENDLAAHKADYVKHSADYVKHPGTGKTTNSGHAYAVTLNPAPASYIDQMGVIITVNTDSSGASTLNINGLGAKPIKKANGNDVTNLKANGVYTLRYNADTGNFILQGEGASGNAVASDLLSGKTASTDAGDIVGNMPNRGAFNLSLGANVPAGYYSGGTVPNGKKFYVGEVYATTTQIEFRELRTSLGFANSYYISAALNLPFTPYGIIWYEKVLTNYAQGSFFKNSPYDEGQETSYVYSTHGYTSIGSNSVRGFVPKYTYDSSGLYLNSKGFVVPVPTGNIIYRFVIFEK